MSSPFYQPARQSFSFSQNMQQPQGGFGGFGGGQGFGGFQQQSWGGGFGGNQGFGGFGGGGFQPQGFGFGGGYGGGFGNFGGFQPQQQFNPYQGGFGGFGGFGGGYNPMFGGIGGLGFNPMMGPQFGMPMSGFGSEDRSGQWESFLQSQFQPQYNPDRANESGMPMQAPFQQQVQLNRPQQNPFEDQQRQLRTQIEALPEYQAFQAAQNAYGAKQQELPEYVAVQNAQKAFESSEGYKSFQQKQQELNEQYNRAQGQRMRQAQMPRDIQTGQPMYGGIGGLGFNPMMGPQFGMPMQGLNPYQQKIQFQPQMTAESAADINRAREQRENMQMQNTRSNWSQAGQGATSGMDFLQRLQGLSGGSYVPLSGEQMALERDARLYSMTPQQRAMALG